MKTTVKQLKQSFAELAEISGYSTTLEGAKQQGQDKYLFMEYAAHYGGYRIVLVGVSNGGHYGAFGGNGCESRLSKSEMTVKIESLIYGIKHAKTA